MLAVQPAPRMGSSQPPSDLNLPFGYSHEPLPEAPEPAPGDPLLTEDDRTILSSFFSDINDSQFNVPSFGEGLVFDPSFYSLPPQFVGSTTSFSQPPPSISPSSAPLQFSNHAHDFHGGMSMPPPPPPPAMQPQPQMHQQNMHHGEHSDDVLNAAATLLQNGSSQRRHSSFAETGISRRLVVPPVGHLRHQPLEEFREDNRRSLLAVQHDNTFTDWMWGPSVDRRSSLPRQPPPVDVQWGSDSNFSHMQSYMPDSKETAESLSKEQLKHLECLEPSRSTDTTRPSSPSNPQMTTQQHKSYNQSHAKRVDETDAPPRKRRKSKAAKEIAVVDEDEDEEMTTPKPARRRKARSERGSVVMIEPAETPTASKRRKSIALAAKPTRENLSEEQKRENHIRSEQKRRTLIKEGFDDLCNLVPGMRGGGFSKSTMLTMAAEWLEDVISGNDALRAKLTELQKRG